MERSVEDRSKHLDFRAQNAGARVRQALLESAGGGDLRAVALTNRTQRAWVLGILWA